MIFGNFQRLPWEQHAPFHENDGTVADKNSGIFDNNQQTYLEKSIIQDWENIYDTFWEHSFTLHQFLSQEMLEPRVYVVSRTQLSYSSFNFLLCCLGFF